MSSFQDVAEDKLIRDVLGVTLQPTQGESHEHYLAALSAVKLSHDGWVVNPVLQDLRSGGEGTVLLKRQIVDRVLVARLIDEPPSVFVFSPFQYVLHCYGNLYQQTRVLPNKYRNQPALLQRLNETLVEMKDLLLSFAGLVFNGGIIPNV